MRVSSTFLAATGLLSTANAAIKGFNYGAQFNNNQAKTLVDFEYEFNAAKQLPGTDGWTSARIYTMIQHGTQNTIIEAIQAAINTKTTLLLGMWASAGQQVFDNEIAALKAAVQQYGTAFTDLVVGISVGSEDLYRVTPTGISNNAGPGAQPSELVRYIQQTRDAIRGTSLEGKPIGHVDTWTVYVNATNNPVIEALDFIGMDAYPYFQTTMANSIGSASQLFFDAYYATVGAAQGKPVWVTETGWPVTGQTLNQAEPSADNARIFWEDVTCQLVKDNVNLYYYILQDVQYGNPVPSFGIKPAGDLLSVQPLFDLSCPASAKPSSSIVSRRSSSSSNGVPISSGTFPQLSSTHPTIQPTVITAPVITFDHPTPTLVPSPSILLSSGLSFEDLPASLTTRGLPEPFETPHLIYPVEKTYPNKVVENGYIAQLSPTVSTVLVYDIHPAHQGKTCSLTFHLPPPFEYVDLAPFKIRAPGGISVSHLGNQVPAKVSTVGISSLNVVGSVASIQPGHQYNVASAPCEAGQRVGYQVDSLNGLSMDWLQMTSPPLGLFVLVT